MTADAANANFTHESSPPRHLAAVPENQAGIDDNPALQITEFDPSLSDEELASVVKTRLGYIPAGLSKDDYDQERRQSRATNVGLIFRAHGFIETHAEALALSKGYDDVESRTGDYNAEYYTNLRDRYEDSPIMTFFDRLLDSLPSSSTSTQRRDDVVRMLRSSLLILETRDQTNEKE